MSGANSIAEMFIVFWGTMHPNRNAFMVLKPVAGREQTYEKLVVFWLELSNEIDTAELDGMSAWCWDRRDIMIT